MRYRFTLLLVSTLILSVKGQFQRTYGKFSHDYVYSMCKAGNGNYAFAGTSNNYGGTNYFFLFKITPAGDTLWMKGYPVNAVNGHSISNSSDGGFIVAGSTGVFKTDSLGNSQWGITSTSMQFYSAQQTADGGFIAGGTIGFSSSSNGIDVYLLKLNSLGIKQWSRKYGDSLDDVCSAILQTNDGGYIVAGHTSSFGAGATDVYLMKLNNSGDTVWTKTYGGTNSEGNTSWKEVIQQTKDKGYIIGATTTSFGAGGADAYLVKTDSLGNIQWSKSYGGSQTEVLYDVKEVSGGGYIFTAVSNSFGGINDFYVVRTDINGDTLWTKTYGGANAEVPGSIEEKTDKGFIIAGYTKSFGAGNNDAYVIWTDSMGNTSCNQHNTSTTVTNCSTITSSSPTNKTFITLNVTSFSPTPKRGGGFTDACVVNDIETIKGENGILAVFPNPNNGVFTVSLKDQAKDKIKVSVSNLLGEVICSEVRENNSMIDLSRFPDGIYLLKAEGETTYIKQIIINK